LVRYEIEFLKDVLSDIKLLFKYFPTIHFIQRKKGFRAAYNFLFVKLFVKEGEGSMGLAYNLLVNPLRRIFPRVGPLIAPYPRNLEIEITNKCNKRCIVCEHTYWNEPAVDLSFEDFKKIVDQFPKLKWVNLTGEGDAFLNKDYLKMIRYLKSRDVPVYLVDSFDLINEEIAKKIVELGVEGTYVSFDAATKETYEKIKVGCNFDRTINNIKNLIKIRREMKSPIPEICFRYIVTTLNFQEMPQYIQLVRSFGDKSDLGAGSRIEFVGVLVFDEVKHLYVEEIPDEIMRTMLKNAKDLGITVTYAHCGEKTLIEPMTYCVHWLEPYIMMGGYVLPCCTILQNNKRDFLRKYSFGNILKEDFKTIWNSERYKKFRKLVATRNGKVPILCKGCRAYDTRERERLYGVDEQI